MRSGTRLIPAHAGKTSLSASALVGKRAHPRSRGENSDDELANGAPGGSSPLTRGKPVSAGRWVGPVRLIPAHAGKTRMPESPRPSRGAHPRSRGENPRSRSWCSRGRGSSPLTRGKRGRKFGVAALGGLIPAHAGKTRSPLTRRRASTAHPRSRGENTGTSGPGLTAAGSSPLTRGKRQEQSPSQSPAGLIPAHAGKTLTRHRERQALRAHPRSRGENPLATLRGITSSGSSPLTRGKPGALGLLSRGSGLIPAHAGKTCSSRRCRAHARAHPRSRGENR